jgi:hypothetical protein
MDRHQVGQVDLGIDLSGGQGAVAEEFLDGAKVHARFEEMGRESVPQCVWVEMIEISAAADGAVELTADGAVAESAPALVDEKRVVVVRYVSTPAGAFWEIGLDGFGRRPAERHQAFLASFAAHTDDPLSELEITEIEGYELADTEPRRVEELYGRAVAAPSAGVWKSLEKLLYGISIGNFGRPFHIAGMGYGICRASVEGALGDQKTEVGTESGKGPGDRAWLETTRVEVCKVGPYGQRGHSSGLVAAELRGREIDEGADFTGVGAKRGGREIAFPFKVLDEGVDHPGTASLLAIAFIHESAFGR